MPKTSDIYNPVSTVSPQGGSGNDYLNIRSTPDAFGAQVGGAVQRAGAEFQQTGEKAVALASHIQGMVNETLATNADAELAKKVGDIKGDFFSKTGLEAAAALPQYQTSLEQARQEVRSSLPGGAAHMYDTLATRSIANSIADGSVHAAGQIKAARIDSGSSLQNNAVLALADPSVAANPTRVGEHLADIHWGAQMQLPDPVNPGYGLKTDPDTGEVKFDESTQEGQNAKAQFENNVNNMVALGQVNRFTTLAKHDPLGTYDMYMKERAGLPRMAQVKLDATLEPMVFQAHKSNVVQGTLTDAAQAHQEMLFNPEISSAGSSSNNLGNVKTASGAANGTQDFVAPATPMDGVILTANNLRTANYQGKTLEQISKTWTGESPEKAAAWASNVSKASGIPIGAVPDLNDPKQLSAMMKGIAVAEKSPTDRAKFTDDVISQGVDASLKGQSPSTAQQTAKNPETGQNSAKYGTNPDGSPLTQADYFRTHSLDVYGRGDEYAEKTMPGNLQFKHSVHQSLENYMSQTISNQSAQYAQDNRYIMKGITGALTKGNPPATYAELRNLPGMSDILDRVAYQDPKFSEGIEIQINRMARRDDVENSPNAYPTVLRVLEPNDPQNNPNRISSQDHLNKMLGYAGGNGINKKDYNDASQAIELNQNIKDKLRKGMIATENANGNVDGLGQQRALQWYQQTMTEYKQNAALGDKKLSDTQFANSIGTEKGPAQPSMPSRIQQIANLNKAEPAAISIPVFSSPADPEFAKLPPGSQFLVPGETTPRIKK